MINNLKSAFKSCLDRRILHIALYDLLFFLAALLSFRLFFNIIKARHELITSIDISKIHPLETAQISSLVSLLRGFFILIIALAILYYIILLLSCTLFKGLIWLKITGNKWSLKFWLRLIIAKLVYSIVVIAVIAFFAWTLKSPANLVVAIILILLALHFSILINIFSIKLAPLSSIKAALIEGTRNAKYFIIPYLIILAIASLLFWLIMSISATITSFYLTLLIVFSLYFACSRLFLYSFIKNYLKGMP